MEPDDIGDFHFPMGSPVCIPIGLGVAHRHLRRVNMQAAGHLKPGGSNQTCFASVGPLSSNALPPY